jgi:hypothetical protein
MDKCGEISLRSIRKMKNLKKALKGINPRPVGVDRFSREAFRDPIRFCRHDPNLLNFSPQLKPLQSLQQDLAYGWIPDPTESFRFRKRRLERGTVGNRLVEKAISRKLNRSLDRLFSHSSYGYRPRRSSELAILAIRDVIRGGYYWAFKTDISSFFDNVRREILDDQVRSVIADEPLCNAILNAVSPVRIERGRSFLRQDGLPQGNGLAPFLSNPYMDGFDRACGDLHYFRFADDILVLAHSEHEAKETRERLRGLAEFHGLSLNLRKTFVQDVRSRAIYYLGYALSGGNIYPSKRSIRQLEQRLIRFQGQRVQGLNAMKGFVRRFRIGPVRKLFRRLDCKLGNLYPPGQTLVSLLDVVRMSIRVL